MLIESSIFGFQDRIVRGSEKAQIAPVELSRVVLRCRQFAYSSLRLQRQKKETRIFRFAPCGNTLQSAHEQGSFRHLQSVIVQNATDSMCVRQDGIQGIAQIQVEKLVGLLSGVSDDWHTNRL